MRKTLLASAAVVAFAAAALPATSGASYTHQVVPGVSIEGVSIGETLPAVHSSRPLALAAPTASALVPVPALGGANALFETYTTADNMGGTISMIVAYQLPPPQKHKHKKKKKKKRAQPKVVFVTTGQGFWIIPDTLIHTTAPGVQASNINDVATFYNCAANYAKTPSGGRDYNVDPVDGQYCELHFLGNGNWFYFTFNNGTTYSGSDFTPALLSGMTLSAFQIFP